MTVAPGNIYTGNGMVDLCPVAFDLYHHLCKGSKRESTLPLLKKVFEWARSVNPDQPVSAGMWSWDFEKLNEFQFTNSDIITYHNYDEPQWHLRTAELLKIICACLLRNW